LPYARAMALYPSAGTANDGKIVLAGTASGRNTGSDFALVRYNRDGSLDTAFGNRGLVTTDFVVSIDLLYALAIQPDGKIVAVGQIQSGPNASTDVIALARYNANGSLDTTFDNDGKVISALGDGWAEANAVAVQTDGRIVVGGRIVLGGLSQYQFAVARYNA